VGITFTQPAVATNLRFLDSATVPPYALLPSDSPQAYASTEPPTMQRALLSLTPSTAKRA
jgi:hypothetical protein